MKTLVFGAIALLAVACSTDAETNAPLPAGQCREPEDCDTGNLCVPSGTNDACGPSECTDNECNADFDCKQALLGDICVTLSGVRVCRPSCGEAFPCEAHESCESNGHCEAKECADDSACPTNFGCLPNVCRRRFCEDDSSCEGHCVNGECFSALGACEAPPTP